MVRADPVRVLCVVKASLAKQEMMEMRIHLPRLHSVNFDVKEGSITVMTGLSGLSGSGKSPLICHRN